MLVVFSFSHVDHDMALKNARWIATLKNKRHHRFIVAVNQLGRDKAQPVLEALAACGEIELFVPSDEEERPWPWAQNHMFASCARYVRDAHKDEPWLWLEGNDAVPLKDLWLDLIEKEYQDGGQPFLGMYVAALGHDGKPIPAHMSGIGVYPNWVAKWCPKALLASNLAFDMTLAEVTLDNMTRSNLIHHVYKAPKFKDLEDYHARVDKNAVIYHTDKTGSIIDILSPILNRAQVDSAGALSLPPVQDLVHVPAPINMPTTDLFVKTYTDDFQWLKYCIRSIHRFATGFRKLVIITPEMEGLEVPDGPVKVEIQRIQDKEPGYLWQQAIKLDADKYTDADNICFIDSDCIFTKPVTPESFLKDGKPIWLWTPWAELGTENATVLQWKSVMILFLGHTPVGEMMRRHPFIFPRWFFQQLRDFCELMHGRSLTSYIMGSKQFSEFNCAGGYAYAAHHNKFHWMNTVVDAIPEPVINQEWSWGGLTDEIKCKLEMLLKGGDEPCTTLKKSVIADDIQRAHAHSTVASDGAATFNPESAPVTVAVAINLLKSEAAKNPLAKARIVKSLRAAQIIK